jgi:single-stranded DNA-binding protein
VRRERKCRGCEAAGLAKRVEVYVEGRLTMNTWEGKDGQQRTGLSVSAWRVEVLGQIGRATRRERAEPGALNDAIPF